MRRILTLGLAALYLCFGSLAGLAHVHGTADHHEESRGLHLGHAHLDDAADHGREHDHDHDDDGDAHVGSHRFEHHEGDAATLTSSAIRSNPSVRILPAISAAATSVDPPVPTWEPEGEHPRQPVEPVRKIPPRLRAPPA